MSEYELKMAYHNNFLGYHTVLSFLGVSAGVVPEPPGRDEGLDHGSRAGIFILSSHKYPYSKALDKDGIIVSHYRAVMHCRAAERANIFLKNSNNPSEKIDVRLMSERDQQASSTFSARSY